jgi:hypothetical protein
MMAKLQLDIMVILAPIKTAKRHQKPQSLTRNPNEIQFINKIPKLHVDQNNRASAIMLPKNRHHKYPDNPARDTDPTKDFQTPARLSACSPSDSPVQQRPVTAFTFPFKTRAAQICQDLFTATRKFPLTGSFPEITPKSARFSLPPNRDAGS